MSKDLPALERYVAFGTSARAIVHRQGLMLDCETIQLKGRKVLAK